MTTLNITDRTCQTMIVCLVGVALLSGCGKSESKSSTTKSESNSAKQNGQPKVDFAALRPKIDHFCGGCHAVPDPQSFPKEAWYEEVAQGYRFFDESGREDLTPPPRDAVVAYYRHHAPETLQFPRIATTSRHATVTFQHRHHLPLKAKDDSSLSYLGIGKTVAGGKPLLLYTDMRTGDVRQFDPRSPDETAPPLATLQNPASISPVQFIKGGPPEFVAAELGSFLPMDHNKGRISWLRGRKNGVGFDAVVLKDGLGRVADVQPADFDGDGKLDLIVAEFGWRRTGRILLLRQTGRKDGVPEFETTIVDKRHGTIHVPVMDLNGDGKPDFVALVSQEYEVVDAFLNLGNGRFEKKRIYEAPDPSFGSSGIQMVDLDRDGDLDVVYTNGDSLDSHYLKPYHAVHWLENEGTFPFKHHEITRLPGASRAVAADLDGDGDLDIACAAYLPKTVVHEKAGGKIETLIWLEQTKSKTFVRHGIEQSASGYLCLLARDFDGDGRIDLAAGHFMKSDANARLTIWSNIPAASGKR